MRPKHRPGVRKLAWRQNRRGSGRDHALEVARKVNDACPSSQIRPNLAIPSAEINEKIQDSRFLGTAAIFLIETSTGGCGVQMQAVSVPDEIALNAEVIVQVQARKRIQGASVRR